MATLPHLQSPDFPQMVAPGLTALVVIDIAAALSSGTVSTMLFGVSFVLSVRSPP